MTLSLLVIDDDETVRSTLVEFFETFGFTARGASTATEGRQLAAEHAPDVVLLDLRLPDADGVRALEALRADDPDLAVIVLTGYADVRTAVAAMKHGAADLLEKPVDLELLASAVTRAAERGRLRQEVAVLRAQGRSNATPPAMAPTVSDLIDLAARNPDAPILLQGETGTGKGYIARQIHDRSVRNLSPFVEINCASLSATFFESELFGHERGAFTDARQAKHGLLEVAGEGTVFLDEIAELSTEVQPRLLKVLEERTFRRLGGTTMLRSSSRVVVATHQSLADAVAEKRFRADLYYRLQVLTITLPPLRERQDEILTMAMSMLPKGSSLTNEAEDALAGYRWPGNIRELKNTIWRAAILAEGRPIEPAHLGLAVPEAPRAAVGTTPNEPRTLEQAEREVIREALVASGGNRTHAARLLGIARSTLLEKLKRYPADFG
ncbi:sigma-54-dependent transcriptional regulator [Gemmatimonas groenlandica]|uniref:Sigma-54-dependent Fis family transcriptional regulator n=1 Tax=Gemmatimonas groenlandica TaxID=2732249 RepID=A0A6M4INU0_9BACT|nr:sigma-54 dependent transcriptional regulator [Gemmatimonas groenlandica]QJR36634.1 sigma-54-dependent Fis family transcriptional regulator [Gemmatimonas groenlandica]